MPPEGFGFPFGGAFPLRPFEIRGFKSIAFFTLIQNLLREVMRRSSQKMPIFGDGVGFYIRLEAFALGSSPKFP